MPTLTQYRDWLKTQPGSLSDEQLQVIVSGETAAQAGVCAIPLSGPTDDLVLALYMRVARNCARRGVPLGIVTGIGDGGFGSARPTAFDPDITRLEAPYRPLTAG